MKNTPKKEILPDLLAMNWEDLFDGGNPSWRTEARKLMEQGKRFVMVNWTGSGEWSDCDALVNEFGYDYKAHLPTQRVFFYPRLPK